MNRVPLHAWVSHHHHIPLPAGHPFPAEKYDSLLALLLESGTVHPEHVHRSEPAPPEWLALVHDPSYVDRAMDGGLTPGEQRALGLPWSRELTVRARAAVTGTVEAARAAFEHGIAGNLAGGSHHAFRDRGEAFCVFHDMAIAIAVLRRSGCARRPLVIDLDVHQGNGTAALFRDDDAVFTLSVHGASNYPARKECSTLDVEIEDGCGDDAYLARLTPALERAFAHAPDFVIYQAGVDALAGDRFGRLALTLEGLARRDDMVFAGVERLGVPVVVTLGGGYTRPADPTIAAHAQVWRAMRASASRRAAAVNPVDAAVHAARDSSPSSISLDRSREGS